MKLTLTLPCFGEGWLPEKDGWEAREGEGR